VAALSPCNAITDPTHVYTTPGVYTVSLSVAVGDESATLTRTHYVTVTAAGGVVTGTRVISYTYDPLGRLVEADYSTGESFEYRYDAVGNRTAMTETTVLAETTVTTYTYDAANRLLVSESPGHLVTYAWDARGNLTNDSVFTYTYNAAGRLVRAEGVTSTLVYTYNAAGLRVAQSVDGGATTFAWDWALSLPQMLATSDGALDVYGLARIGELRDSAWSYSLGDELNSVRQWADGSGYVTYAAGHTPFGEYLWQDGSTDSAWGYTGEWRDSSAGAIYLRARWYRPSEGRFSQKDPWEGNQKQPLTMNPYLYVLANPVRYVDPAGWYPVDPPGGVCQEKECVIHPVVTFIIGKIREDSASEEIERIRELNGSHRYEDAWAECQRMPWWQRLLFCHQYLERALDIDIAARNAALVEFGCLVADARLRPTCGRWDYKKEIGESERLGYNAQRIDFCSIGIDEEVVFYYDIWANVHFGYLGMVGGFSEELLLEGAAIEHMGSNLGQTKDDPSDQVCAEIGIRLYRSALTEKTLLTQLYLHRYELNKARRNESGEFEVYR
jgi:RHS repeat-associated protein